MNKIIASFLSCLLILVGVADAREWHTEDISAPDWGIPMDGVMGLSTGSVVGSGLPGDWADEVQICFSLPHPEYGGPWLVTYIALYMTGSSSRDIVIRTASDLASPPGTAVATPKSFTPGETSWPPSDWTYVKLYNTIGGASPYLLLSEGDLLMIGVELLSGDTIGLGNPEADVNGWGYYNTDWIDDSGDWGLIPAIRIGMEDTGLTPVDTTSWGMIKTYF